MWNVNASGSNVLVARKITRHWVLDCCSKQVAIAVLADTWMRTTIAAGLYKHLPLVRRRGTRVLYRIVCNNLASFQILHAHNVVKLEARAYR